MKVKLNDKFKNASIFLNELLSQIEDLNVKKQIFETDKSKSFKRCMACEDIRNRDKFSRAEE